MAFTTCQGKHGDRDSNGLRYRREMRRDRNTEHPFEQAERDQADAVKAAEENNYFEANRHAWNASDAAKANSDLVAGAYLVAEAHLDAATAHRHAVSAHIAAALVASLITEKLKHTDAVIHHSYIAMEHSFKAASQIVEEDR
jgi:transcriptional regulator NrdR family protein